MGELSRREAIIGGVAALGAFSLREADTRADETTETKEQKRFSIRRQIEFVFEKAFKEIDFPEKFIPETEHSKKLAALFDLYKKSGEQKIKLQIWNVCKEIFPDLGDYSDDEYLRAVLVLLPSYLANQGIVAIELTGLITDEDGFIDEIRVALDFFRIINNDAGENRSKKRGINVFYVEPYSEDDTTLGDGQTCGGNILIHKKMMGDAVQRHAAEETNARISFADKSGTDISEILRRQLESVDGQSQDEGTLRASFIRLQRKVIDRGGFKGEDYLDDVVTHEIGHVESNYELFESGTVKRILPSTVATGRQYERFLKILEKCGEIKAKLIEFKFSKNKARYLKWLIETSTQGVTGDTMASKEIIQSIIKEIKHNSTQYNFNYDHTSRLSVENQILFWLADLTDNEDALVALAERLIDKYRDVYVDNLVPFYEECRRETESLDANIKKSKPVRKGKEEEINFNTLIGCVGAAGVVSAYALYKLWERKRQTNSVEEKSGGSAKGHKGHRQSRKKKKRR